MPSSPYYNAKQIVDRILPPDSEDKYPCVNAIRSDALLQEISELIFQAYNTGITHGRLELARQIRKLKP